MAVKSSFTAALLQYDEDSDACQSLSRGEVELQHALYNVVFCDVPLAF